MFCREVEEKGVKGEQNKDEELLGVTLYQKRHDDMSGKILLCFPCSYFFGGGRTLSRSFLLLVEVSTFYIGLGGDNIATQDAL